LVEVASPALIPGVVTEKTDSSVTVDLPEAFPARSFTYDPEVSVSLGGFGTTELKPGSLSDMVPGKIVFLFLAAPYQGKTESITKLIVVQPPTAAAAAGEETNDLDSSTQ
jgi:hypothetical protein